MGNKTRYLYCLLLYVADEKAGTKNTPYIISNALSLTVGADHARCVRPRAPPLPALHQHRRVRVPRWDGHEPRRASHEGQGPDTAAVVGRRRLRRPGSPQRLSRLLRDLHLT